LPPEYIFSPAYGEPTSEFPHIFGRPVKSEIEDGQDRATFTQLFPILAQEKPIPAQEFQSTIEIWLRTIANRERLAF
jgi:hypothetical protein